MRITAIDIYWLRLPLAAQVADAMTDLSSCDFIAAKVTTDDGPVGWGYNCTIGERNARHSAVERSGTSLHWT